MSLDKNTLAFLELVRAGLWEKEARLEQYGKVDFEEIYRLAGEQSVIGIVLAGIERQRSANVKLNIDQELLLQWIGEVQMLEQQNKAMNQFIAELVEKMREADIYTLLVKGQGIAQCYERPFWRACGDVDFFLSEENFLKARRFLKPFVSNGFDPDSEKARNISAQFLSWDIELHANQDCGLSRRMDKVIREIQNSVFYGGEVRSWMNGKTKVFLPEANCDVIFVFTHFLKHFYKGGLGLRQICDWCRLLWTYRDSLNHGLLETWIKKMGLMTEWKAFGAFAVTYLGMPSEAMPLYNPAEKWQIKADRICNFIVEVGNMGHKRDSSFYNVEIRVLRKYKSFHRRVSDLINHSWIFPLDSLRFLLNIIFNGLRLFMR